MPPRLKSLELQGYKTFASKNHFEFPGKITAIVGPNGSGKSNIADALRWVLGEQSYSLLRGRKTEDMIFSGSELRAKAGMASASITFDNSDNWLPIDFSEVSIARRAYRDGQNEYLLNGQRIRLKETSELLAQSGLAERTYTIIGQGLVDAALSLKPEERRRFFEEAAGIGLYRSRREEALNRLDATRRNLERVRDILNELEPRLKSLERQSQRFNDYERLKADLQVLLRDWYGFHWHRIQKELIKTQENLTVQDDRLEITRRDYDLVENQFTGLRQEILELRSVLNDWHSESAGFHNQREKISKNLAVLDERQRSSIEQRQMIEIESTRLEEESRARQKQIEEINNDIQLLSDELVEAQRQSNLAQGALERRQEERNKIERTLKETRRQLVTGETKVVQIKAHQNELTNRVSTLERTQKSLDESISTLDASIHQIEAKIELAKGEIEQSEDELNEIDIEKSKAQELTLRLESERKTLQIERTKVETEKSKLKAQIDVLEQAEKSYSGLNEGAKNVLQESQKGKIFGEYIPLNSIIEVPQHLEKAISAVLGEYLDAILLKTKTNADAVLKFLSGGDKGRAILIPLDEAKTAKLSQMPELKDHANIIGFAAQLVKTPSDYKNVMDVLLGQVVVVNNRQDAQKIAADLPAFASAVTLEGEVFRGNGVILAGLEGRSGMIARPRQKRELQMSLDSSESRLSFVLDQFEELALKNRDTEKLQKDLEAKFSEAEKQLKQNNQKLQQEINALEQSRQKLEWQKNQYQSNQEQIEKAKIELNKIEAEMAHILEENVSLNEMVKSTAQTLDQIPLSEFQEQVVHWNTNSALASRALKDSKRRLDEFQQILQNSMSLQEGLKKRLMDFESSVNQIDENKILLRSQETEINEQIESLNKKIQPAEKELNEKEELYTLIQEKLTSAQQAVSQAERYSTQAQLEFTRTREAMENLQRRIEEDFGLVAFEYESNVSGPTPLPLEGMVAQLPMLEEVDSELEENINRMRAQLRRMGAINPEAQNEYLSVKSRFEFLTTQVSDLQRADEDLRQVIAELDTLMRIEFRKTFDAVAIEFKDMFTRLFGGGTAKLILTNDEIPAETGIDIEARLPGRREQGLSLLSGGERSLTAVALIFSLLKVSPTPFCVLDEVDAALDEANVGRFTDLLVELSKTTQFIVITHNRNTVQVADVIYGVTMGRDSVSQVISLRLDEVGDDFVK